MSDTGKHIDEQTEQRLKAIMASSAQADEFVVPDMFFDSQAETIVAQCRLPDTNGDIHFETPPDYFVDSENRILAEIHSAESDNSDFFAEQQNEILARIKLDEFGFAKSDEFEVPDGYFEIVTEHILAQNVRSEQETKVIPFHKTGHARMWMGIAAAACIAFLMVMIWPQNQPPTYQPSFAELLEKTELDESDLEYFATEEEYEQLLLNEIDLLTDTLIADSLKVVSPALSKPIQPEKDKKDKKDIKPKDKKKTPSFDDLTEEEILEFLLEEGGDDILDDL